VRCAHDTSRLVRLYTSPGGSGGVRRLRVVSVSVVSCFEETSLASSPEVADWSEDQDEDEDEDEG
jgi:hypothetical protein